MHVITLAGSPRYPSRSSASLGYAREAFIAVDIEACHWHLQNFVPEDLLYACFDNPALQTLNEQPAGTDGPIITTPVYKASFSGAPEILLDLPPERALEDKVVLSLATDGTIAHILAVDYTLRPVLNALGAWEILHGVPADDNQVMDYQHKSQFTPDLQRRLDESLETLWQALHCPSSCAPSLTSLRGVEYVQSSPCADPRRTAVVLRAGSCRPDDA